MEDEAPRLRAMFPRLTSLRLDVRERRVGAPVPEAGYIRRIVLETAPALFLLPCGDPSCRNGGHDVTQEVLRGLRAGMERLEGQDACMGQTGTAQCRRELEYIGIAAYA